MDEYVSMFIKVKKTLYKKLILCKGLNKKKIYEIIEEALNMYFDKYPINRKDFEDIL
ncbi:MAG TPA: hypothetical protein PLW61_03425 [Caldisericia bacterium]|mgnify:FL=1|nr:hypothetical protein [Caldisericia bacterium]HQP00290.1 hypothetical protein [Caldisericia bacterium]